MYHGLLSEVIPMLPRFLRPGLLPWLLVPSMVVACGGPIESERLAESLHPASDVTLPAARPTVRITGAPSLEGRPASLGLPGSVQQAAPAVETLTFSGLATGTSTAIGLVQQGTQVALYVCGGTTGYAHWSQTGGWFIGNTDSTGHFSFAQGGTSVIGSVSATGSSGTMTDSTGETLSWSFAPASSTDGSGLYQATVTGGCMTGVIVWSDSDGLHSQGAWCDGLGDFAQVIPARPLAGAPSNGFPAMAMTPGGEVDFEVTSADGLVGG